MSREQAIANLTPVFRQFGYEGSTLSRLSRATGLGRASLYHHFPGGKEEMAAAVLERANQILDQTVLDPLRQDLDPYQRLQHMCRSLSEFYHQGQDACLLAILSLGEADDRFHEQVRAAMVVWIEALAQALQAAGLSPSVAQERAEDALMQIQGALVVVRGLGDCRPFRRLMARLPQELLKAETPID